MLESATSSCCLWTKYAVGFFFLSLTCGDAEEVALVGVTIHLPSILPILQAFYVLLQQFLVALVSDFPVEEAVICKQSDAKGPACIRKVIDVGQV